jgi:GNAT superfamily N-acetyltransferase
MPFTISDLRQRPAFFDSVADRIWQAWWKADGHPLDYITVRLRENLSAAPIPFALVAHDAEGFLGTASVIASDLAERPHLTPWIAAVWVEPQARRRGVGAALVKPRRAGLLCARGRPRLFVRAPAAFGFL